MSDWQESFDYDGQFGYEYLHFKPTSPNWKTWEYRVKGTVQESDDAYQEAKELDYVIIWARAYKDANETKWNQDFIKVSLRETSGGGYEAEISGEEGGGLSSTTLAILAGVIIVIIVLVAVAVMMSRKKQGAGGNVE